MESHTNGSTRTNGHSPAPVPPASDGAWPLLWDGLQAAVVEKLGQTLDPGLVSSRKGRGGRSYPYVEGHIAIAQANRVFGYGGWGYELVGDVAFREVQSVDAKTGEVATTGMYVATVRVTVPGVPSRMDVGCHAVADDTSDGHDTAYKGAVTDALKRALRSFGDQFGNSLYGESPRDDVAASLRESIVQLARTQGIGDAKLQAAVKKRTGHSLESLSSSELAKLLQAMTRKSAANGSASPSA